MGLNICEKARKIRIKRIKHFNTGYNKHLLDDEFLKGFIMRLPKIGKSLCVDLGKEYWWTTPVLTIESKRTVIIVRTQNSVYHIKLGWKA